MKVFSKAFELWKRDVLWLILAGVVIGVIIWAVLLVAGLIVGALAIGGVGLGLSGSNNAFSGAGAGVIFVAIIVGIVAAFLVAVLGVTLQGGLFEMVIGAAREAGRSGSATCSAGSAASAPMRCSLSSCSASSSDSGSCSSL